MIEKGFQIEVQVGLTCEEWAAAAKFIKECFIDRLKDGCWHHMTRGGHGGMPFGRNLLGFRINDTNLTFRRLSKSTRIFGVVRIDTLEPADGSGVIPEGCVCRHCIGGTRVRWKTTKPETVIVHRQGVISG